MDCNAVIGSGHIVRCIALAEHFLNHSARISFLSAEPLPQHIQDDHPEYDFYSLPIDKEPSRLKEKSSGTSDGYPELAHDHFRITSQSYDADISRKVIEKCGCDILILDHYGLDFRWEEKLRDCVETLVVIDDLADRRHSCDFLVDQSRPAANEGDYLTLLPASAVRLIGPEYALLRPEFSLSEKDRSIRSKVNSILVFFGGVDIDNYTAVTLETLAESTWHKKAITVVLGAQNPHEASISVLAAAMNAEVIVQTRQMGALMKAADIAIGAAGSASWERAAVGLPSIVASVADNQNSVLNALLSYGVAMPLPREKHAYTTALADAIVTLDKAPNQISIMSQRCYQLCDGKGIERIVSRIIET